MAVDVVRTLEGETMNPSVAQWTDREYQRAKERLEQLMIGNPSPKSLRGRRLIVVAELIERYEADQFGGRDDDQRNATD